MITAKKIKTHYELTLDEEKVLGSLSELMKEHQESFAEDFYHFIMAQDDMALFFHDEKTLDHHKKLIAAWFVRLFSGNYEEAYFRDLHRIGKVHVDIDLDGHLVNAAMTRVRHYLTEIVSIHVDKEEQEKTQHAINKILDINLDVLTSSYRQAELKKYFISARAESVLVGLMERFTHGLNLVLALALGVVSIGVIGLFIQDVFKIFHTADLEHSVIAALGSLLIIWMMIELLGTEIQHLKGRHIPIKIFIGIVIVAFIRKVLIGSLEHGSVLDYGTKVGTLLVLALVFWLVARADRV